MPVSFKRPVPVTAVLKTPEQDLVECDTPGCGYNPQGRVAINLQDPVCNGTGFLNYFTEVAIEGYYDPREMKRWNQVEGGFTYQGEASIKFEPKYADIVDAAEFLRMKGVEWNFQSLSERGVGFGNDRRVYALNRKK